jgi:negative regulator of sigma E activity
MGTTPEMEKSLSRYFDGEMSEREKEKIEKMLAEDDELKARLKEMQRLGDLIRMPIQSAAGEVSFDGLWNKIEIEIERIENRPTLWQRVWVLFSELFTYHRYAFAGTIATIVLIITAALLFSTWRPNPEPSIDKSSLPTAAMISAFFDQLPGTINNAYVVTYEVERGIVVIDQEQNDEKQPLVIWHFDEDSGQKG